MLHKSALILSRFYVEEEIQPRSLELRQAAVTLSSLIFKLWLLAFSSSCDSFLWSLCNALYSAELSPVVLPSHHLIDRAFIHPTYLTDHKQIEYRLRTCGELCSGLFTSSYATTSGPLGNIIKARKFPSIDSSDADRKRVLLAHIIATKTSSRIVTDDAMDFPKDYQTKYQLAPNTGHNEDGETVCIHSLCVHPDFQGQGFGQVLLRSYVQRIKDAGVAKRVALICREKYVKFYAKSGFLKVGPSKCQYGGGGWIDMVIELEEDMNEEDQGY